ncbi:MAG: hypothetical protein HY741_06110 [Chloroflexi bacterium]|nr:hypothetical protein [Chloroflexota bacterium]
MTYPDYVRRELARAREIGQYYWGQPDAAAICFDLLADFPECAAASELIYELFCDEWVIYDNRVALQRLIDEWDDQPHQQRRRLALSFGYMSRYEGWHDDDEIGHDAEKSPLAQSEPREVMQFLQQGKMQLLEAYCLGDEEATDYAWERMLRAIEQANDPQHVRLLIAKEYAELGFFADATDLLLEVCSYENNPHARRLLAETRWWRDNAHRIPWIPPPGDGSRYNRLIKLIDPDAPTQEETVEFMRARLREVGNAPTWAPIIDPDLAKQFRDALAGDPETPRPTLVDWSFLNQEDGASTEIAEWVMKDIRRFGRRGAEFKEDMLKSHKLTRPIPPPATPPKRDPNDVRLVDDADDETDDEAFWDELNAELDFPDDESDETENGKAL